MILSCCTFISGALQKCCPVLTLLPGNTNPFFQRCCPVVWTRPLLDTCITNEYFYSIAATNGSIITAFITKVILRIASITNQSCATAWFQNVSLANTCIMNASINSLSCTNVCKITASITKQSCASAFFPHQ